MIRTSARWVLKGWARWGSLGLPLPSPTPSIPQLASVSATCRSRLTSCCRECEGDDKLSFFGSLHKGWSHSLCHVKWRVSIRNHSWRSIILCQRKWRTLHEEMREKHARPQSSSPCYHATFWRQTAQIP